MGAYSEFFKSPLRDLGAKINRMISLLTGLSGNYFLGTLVVT
jgi:hypothetical protein